MGYSFCNGCGVKAPAAGDTHQSISITCPSGHAMVAYVTQKQGSCDACGARVLHGQPVTDCRLCNWYICEQCAQQEVGVQRQRAQRVPAADRTLDRLRLEKAAQANAQQAQPSVMTVSGGRYQMTTSTFEEPVRAQPSPNAAFRRSALYYGTV